jgi:methylmalonyl-CoA mutase cobalamin-binding subunit
VDRDVVDRRLRPSGVSSASAGSVSTSKSPAQRALEASAVAVLVGSMVARKPTSP